MEPIELIFAQFGKKTIEAIIKVIQERDWANKDDINRLKMAKETFFSSNDETDQLAIMDIEELATSSKSAKVREEAGQISKINRLTKGPSNKAGKKAVRKASKKIVKKTRKDPAKKEKDAD